MKKHHKACYKSNINVRTLKKATASTSFPTIIFPEITIQFIINHAN
jgi:hypothetical protein